MSTGWTIGKEARKALLRWSKRESYLPHNDRIQQEIEAFLDRCTDADAPTCPHIVTDREGTSYCRLAESGAGAGELGQESEDAALDAFTADDDDGVLVDHLLRQAEPAQEPVAWRNAITGEIRHSITGLMKHSGNWEPYRKQLPLTDNIDAALDCLYTKAMHLRAHDGPDAHAIGAAYDVVRSALAHPPAALPHGWVAVPVEPSNAEVEAMRAELPELQDTFGARVLVNAMRRAMLAAAPPCPGLVRLPEGFPWTPGVRAAIARALDHEMGWHEDTLRREAFSELSRWIEREGAEQEGRG